MEKTRQKYLQNWLKSQQTHIKQEVKRNVALASVSAVVLVGQVYCFAQILQALIMDHQDRQSLVVYFIGLLLGFVLRAGILWWRERLGFQAGRKIRNEVRRNILQKIDAVGPATLNNKPVGSWATIALEQVENLHNFYARYLPQQTLSVIVPIVVLIAVFPLNWAAGLILFITAPLIPLFMILVGMAAADSSQKNMDVLAKLSGQFLDRLRGLETLILFNKTAEQTAHIEQSTEDFRETTMDVLKKAFLSSAVLEFFTSISIALMAVYFGFSYLGQMNFGSYGTAVSLFAGFFCLTLAPEFYQPLRDLGTYYHDRAAGIGAADVIVDFLETDFVTAQQGVSAQKTDQLLNALNQPHTPRGVAILARDLVVLSPQGQALTKPLNFHLAPNTLTALVGQSGAGKTSLVNTLLGFLAYEGSLTINGIELRELQMPAWRNLIAWVGQNPLLLAGTIKSNLLLGNPNASDAMLEDALRKAQAWEFSEKLGLDRKISDYGSGLSVGQAQRLAVARALLRQSHLLLLDEPTASLDAYSETQVLKALQQLGEVQTTLMITHRIEDLKQCEQILVMRGGEIVQQGHFADLAQAGFFAELLAQRKEDIQ